MSNVVPKVSVIIPVYNVEDYLGECLDSIIQQTLNEIEIICINDGSTDHSLDILHQFAEQDKRVIIINKENGGLSSARNAGLEIAKGEYLYFLDSDDYIARHALELLYVKAKADDLDLLVFNGTAVYETPWLEKQYPAFKTYCHRNFIINTVMNGEKFFCISKKNDLFRASVCLQFIKHSFLEVIGLNFREGIVHEDELFSVVLMLQASRASCLSDIFFYRRIRTNSIMTQKKDSHYFISMHSMLVSMISFALNQNDLEPETKQYISIHLKDNIYWAARNYYKKLSKYEQSSVKDHMNDWESFFFGLLYTRDNLKDLSIFRRVINSYVKNGFKETLKKMMKSMGSISHD